MNVSEYLSAFLAAQGVDRVFEVVGGMITHILDTMHRAGNIRIVSMHHEQGAGFAAEGSARMSGVPGVAMATSGPGATNLLTAIGSCYFDSTPAVFITGQVNRHEQKGTRAIRQLGFQETDVVAMAGPITKAALRIEAPDDVPRILADAFRIAIEGRPGPVLVDLPMDVQRAVLSAPPPTRIAAVPPAVSAPARATIDRMLEALVRAKRPLLLVGGGIRAAAAVRELRTFVDLLGVPVVHSLMAVDVLPTSNPLRVGMIGSYGNRWANVALTEADLIVVLGSRLDVRQTGSEAAAFKGDREVFHVDCDAGEMNNRVTGCVSAEAHLRPFLDAAIGVARARQWPVGTAWQREIHGWRADRPDTAELANVPGINPNVLMHAIAAKSGRARAYVVDVGQHQMWAAQSLDIGPDQRFLTAGGMGAMGFALPAAIGAAVHVNGEPVVVIAGDGGFQLNIQELQTVARNRLALKIVVVNNRTHGMVRQFQQTYFGERYQSTLWGYSAPDFERVAAAYEIASATVSDPGAVESAVAAMWADPAAPFLLQVMVDTYANAYPKLAFGRPMSEMEPDAKPIAMEST